MTALPRSRGPAASQPSSHRVAGLKLVLSGVLGVAVATLAAIACGPPPVGWQGAGRMQTLPAPNPSTDAGDSDSSLGAELADDPAADAGLDANAGNDADDDGGVDADGANDAAGAADGGARG